MKHVLQALHSSSKDQPPIRNIPYLATKKPRVDQENLCTRDEELRLKYDSKLHTQMCTELSEKSSSFSNIELNSSVVLGTQKDKQYRDKLFKTHLRGQCETDGNYHPDFSKVQRKRNCEILGYHTYTNQKNFSDSLDSSGKQSSLHFQGHSKCLNRSVPKYDVKSNTILTLNSPFLKPRLPDALIVENNEQIKVVSPNRSLGKGGKSKLTKIRPKKSSGLLSLMLKVRRKATRSREKKKKVNPKFRKLAADVLTYAEQKHPETVVSKFPVSVSSANSGSDSICSRVSSVLLHQVPPSTSSDRYNAKISTTGPDAVPRSVSEIAVAESFNPASDLHPRNDSTISVLSGRRSGQIVNSFIQYHDNKHNGIGNCSNATGITKESTDHTQSASLIYPDPGQNIPDTVAVLAVGITSPSTASEIYCVPSYNFTDQTSDRKSFFNRDSLTHIAKRRPGTTISYSGVTGPCQQEKNCATLCDITRTDRSKCYLHGYLSGRGNRHPLTLPSSSRITKTSSTITNRLTRSILLGCNLENENNDDSTTPEQLLIATNHHRQQQRLQHKKYPPLTPARLIAAAAAVSSQPSKLVHTEKGATFVEGKLTDHSCVTDILIEKGGVPITADHTQAKPQRRVPSSGSTNNNRICCCRVSNNDFDNCCPYQHLPYCCCFQQSKTNNSTDDLTICLSLLQTDNLPDGDYATGSVQSRDRPIITTDISGTSHATRALADADHRGVKESEKETEASDCFNIQGKDRPIVDIFTTQDSRLFSLSNYHTTSTNAGIAVPTAARIFQEEGSISYTGSQINHHRRRRIVSQCQGDSIATSTFNSYGDQNKITCNDSTNSSNTAEHPDTNIITTADTTFNSDCSQLTFTNTTKGSAGQQDVPLVKEGKRVECCSGISLNGLADFNTNVDSDNDSCYAKPQLVVARRRAAAIPVTRQFVGCGTWPDTLPFKSSRTKVDDKDNTGNDNGGNSNTASNKHSGADEDTSATTKGLIPARSCSLPLTSSLSVAERESVPAFPLLSSVVPTTSFLPVIARSSPVEKTIVTEDRKGATFKDGASSYALNIATTVTLGSGNFTQTTTLALSNSVFTTNVSLTSRPTSASDIRIPIGYQLNECDKDTKEDEKGRSERRKESGKDEQKEKKKVEKEGGKESVCERKSTSTAQREASTWSTTFGGNLSLANWQEGRGKSEGGGVISKTAGKHLTESQLYLIDKHHHHRRNQQGSSRDVGGGGIRSVADHTGLDLPPFQSATTALCCKGLCCKCVEATRCCCCCCTSDHQHYYYYQHNTSPNTDWERSTGAKSTIVSCFKVSEREGTWKSTDTTTTTTTTNNKNNSISANTSSSCNVTFKYGKEKGLSSNTTTGAVAEGGSNHTAPPDPSLVPLLIGGGGGGGGATAPNDGLLPMFMSSDSRLHRRHGKQSSINSSSSSSSSVLLTQGVALHGHPCFSSSAVVRPPSATYTDDVSTTSSSSSSSGSSSRCRRRPIADLGIAELTLLEPKLKPVSKLPSESTSQNSNLRNGLSHQVCSQRDWYNSSKEQEPRNFQNKSPDHSRKSCSYYRCTDTQFTDLPCAANQQYRQFNEQPSQQKLQRESISDNVVLSPGRDFGPGPETTQKLLNKEFKMDSTKIINNQTAGGFHNSAAYTKKYERTAGEGSEEIILTSEYNCCVQSGNLAPSETKTVTKNSSPCKIPVQQKEKTNMNSGTRRSTTSSQLPRSKATLADHSSKTSTGKHPMQYTSTESSRLPPKCTGKKTSINNGGGGANVVKKPADKNIANLKNVSGGKSISGSKIHRNTALSKTKNPARNVSSKDSNELTPGDKQGSRVLSKEAPDNGDSAIDEAKVVNELNDKFRLRSDSESSHASHSSFCSQMSTSSVKSSICLPSTAKSGLGKANKVLTSSCSRLAVSKAETQMQKQPSMLSRATSSTTVTRASNSVLSRSSKMSPDHQATRLCSKVSAENLQRAVSTGSLRNPTSKLSIPTGRSNASTSSARAGGLSMRQKKMTDSASDLSINNRTNRTGTKIQTKDSLRTTSTENLSNRHQRSIGKSCENLLKKPRSVLQASCENLSTKNRGNRTSALSSGSDNMSQQKVTSQNKRPGLSRNTSSSSLVQQREKSSSCVSLPKANRLAGSNSISNSSIPTAAAATDKVDNKKLGNVRSTGTERRMGGGQNTGSQGGN